MKHHVRVDALACAAVGLNHKLYILTRAETFDIRGLSVCSIYTLHFTLV